MEPPALDLGRLTPAERAVAYFAIDGLSNAEIAERRGTRVRTVEKQLSSINRKLDGARPAAAHPPRRNPVSSPQKGNRGS